MFLNHKSHLNFKSVIFTISEASSFMIIIYAVFGI